LPIFEAKSDQNIAAGYIYFAPGGYHLLIEENRSFSLDVSERVSYCRPSIDVLFDSAITVYKAHILAIILSGANEDGAMGATHIIKHKGIVIVQDPATAQNSVMPQAVIAHEAYNYILSPVEMNIVLKRWSDGK